MLERAATSGCPPSKLVVKSYPPWGLMRCCELRGCVGDQRGFVLQATRNDCHALVSLLPFFLLDGFAHGGHRFRGISRVEARRVQLVAVPFAVRQPVLRDELAFAFDEQTVHVVERCRGQRCAAICIGVLDRLAVFGGCARNRVRGVFQRREVLVRRHFFFFRRYVCLFGVRGRGENALVEFAVTFTNLVLHVLRQVF